MPLGPGKYDDLCTLVRELAGIDIVARPGGAIVIVINGKRGNGFSVQADLATMAKLPLLLEVIVKEIRDSTP